MKRLMRIFITLISSPGEREVHIKLSALQSPSRPILWTKEKNVLICSILKQAFA